MNEPGALGRQRAFYASGQHAHLRPRPDDLYAIKLAERVASLAELCPTDRVLEVGAGFGRFTFTLLERCGSVLALDLSERALAELERTRAELGIAGDRCRTLCADAGAVGELDGIGSFDAVVGLFILHHLPDPCGAIRSLARVLAPGGRMAFLEPNRRNPLFLLQVLACRDMTWRDEAGMFRLSGRGVSRCMAEAGLAVRPLVRFGFFPPQIHNRGAAFRSVESRLERQPWIEPVLPFFVARGERAGSAGAAP